MTSPVLMIVIGAAFALPALVPLIARISGVPALIGASAGLAAIFKRVVRGAFAVAAAAGLLIALVQIATLITRNLFGVNFIAVQESLLYLFGAMFLLGGGGILLLDGHVRVDVLYSRWSERRRKAIDIVGTYLFLLPVCALIVMAAWPYVAQSWADLERSSEPSGIHLVYLLKSLIPAFAVLVGMAGVARLHDLLNGGRHV